MRMTLLTENTHTFAQLNLCACHVFLHQIWLPLSLAIKRAWVLKHFSCQNRCSSITFAAQIVIEGAGFPGTWSDCCVAENVHKQSADCSFGPRKSSISLCRPKVTCPVSFCSSVTLWPIWRSCLVSWNCRDERQKVQCWGETTESETDGSLASGDPEH